MSDFGFRVDCARLPKLATVRSSPEIRNPFFHMSSFYFKAVASDGKLRTGTLSGESDKAVARELRKQGLTPVYVGLEQKKSFEFNLPDFYRGRHRDILFFTQELS